jgi:type IV pilus assembly protein PilA
MSFVERCRQRHLGSEGGDEGFTLIELLVVLLIIGILLAIAIPTFLSVTKGANSTAAQSNLTNALTGAKTYYTDSNQSYVGLTTGLGDNGQNTSTIEQIGTGLSYTAGISTGGHQLSDSVETSALGGNWVEFADWAPGANDCWLILDITGTQTSAPNGWPAADTSTGTYYGVLKGLASDATCVATAAPTAANSGTNGFPSG